CSRASSGVFAEPQSRGRDRRSTCRPGRDLQELTRRRKYLSKQASDRSRVALREWPNLSGPSPHQLERVQQSCARVPVSRSIAEPEFLDIRETQPLHPLNRLSPARPSPGTSFSENKS